MSADDQARVHGYSRVGHVLEGKYELTRKLGEGGMGEVYEAVHSVVGRRFAIKFLHPELVRHPDILARFRREARAAGTLRSEHVVTITDFGEAQDGAPYIVMDFLIGEELRRLLTREGQLPVPRAVNLVIQACRGLAAAHAEGIVHRDLKPENLMLCKRDDGTDLIKIVDFGIAKLRSATTSGARTAAGTVIGTLYYMPPEQVRGDTSVDARADVYALGCILYELLSGQLPHPGEEPQQIMFHIVYEQARPLASLRAALPPGLAEVVHKALAPEAADRFPDVRSFAAALAPFAGRQITPLDSLLIPSGPGTGPTAITPPGTFVSAPTQPAESAIVAARARGVDAAPVAETERKRRMQWIAIAVLGVLALALGVVALGLRTSDPPHVVRPAPPDAPAQAAHAPAAGPASEPKPEPEPRMPTAAIAPSAPAPSEPSAEAASPASVAPPPEASKPRPKAPRPALPPVILGTPVAPSSSAPADPLVHKRGRRTLEFSKDNPYQ